MKQPENGLPLPICSTTPCYRDTYVPIACKDGFKVQSGSGITCVNQLGKSAWSEIPKCIRNDDYFTPIVEPIQTAFKDVFKAIFGDTGIINEGKTF